MIYQSVTYNSYKRVSHSLPPLCYFCLPTQRIEGL